MPFLVLLFLLCCRGGGVTQLSAVPYTAPTGEIEPAARLVLIGDAGFASFDKSGRKLTARDPVLEAAEELARQGPDQTAVLFLGDNVYGRKPLLPRAYGGLAPCTGPDCWQAAVEGRSSVLEERQLIEQLDVSRSGRPVWLILGNHDWYRGVEGVRAQEELVAAYAAHHGRTVELLPELVGQRVDRCSGASAVALRRLGAIGIVFLDSQAAMRCPEQHAALREAIWGGVEVLDTPVTVVAGHHPAHSYGPHGRRGTSTLLTRQDIPAGRYRAFIDRTLQPPDGFDHEDRFMVYAAGHEHVLQVLEPKALAPGFDVLVVSGAGSFTHSRTKEFFYVPPAGTSRELTSTEAGVVLLEVDDEGEVALTMVEVDEAGETTPRSWSTTLTPGDAP
jgi:hypothetical protein